VADKRPDYAVRARDHRDKRFWHTVGSAWNATSRDGVVYISVRLNSIPINFDGTLALIESTKDRDQIDTNGE
jgi:uncharacterized protein (DUF736 family)